MRIVSSAAPTVTISKATLMGLMTDVTPDQNKLYRFDGTVKYYRKVTNEGEATFEAGIRYAFIPGQYYTKLQIDAHYPTATLDSITPSTGLAAAGGTTVTLRGHNLGGTSGVTFGGTAATSVTVVNDTTVTCVTPAKTAGSYNVVLTDDSGATPTLTNGATFV